jgi:hypothetical protein
VGAGSGPWLPPPPTLSGSQLAISLERDLIGVDTVTGRVLWRMTTGQFQVGDPLITDDLVCLSVTTDPKGNSDLSGMLPVLGRR